MRHKMKIKSVENSGEFRFGNFELKGARVGPAFGVTFKCIAEGSTKSLAVGSVVPTLRKVREEWGTQM